MTTTIAVPIPASAFSVDSAAHIGTLFLSEQDMVAAGVTDMAACVETMEEVFRCLGEGDFRMAGANGASHGAMVSFPEAPVHEGMPADGPDRRFMAMPAYIGGRFRATGVKWYGSNVENRVVGLPRSIHTFILNDTVTGAPKAMMSANLISAYRTGAVPGVGAKYFARPDAKVAGVVGPGVMGKTAVASFAAVCPLLDTVKIKGRGQASLESFVEWVRREVPQIKNIVIVDTEEQAVRGSDLVTVTTTAPAGSENYPFLKHEWLKPGAFVALPAMTNMDDEFLASDGVRLLVDYRGLYEAWQEEYAPDAFETVGIIGNKFLQMEKSGALPDGKVEDIADVVREVAAGKSVGRTHDEDIIIMSVGGMPVEDVAWAQECYDRARERGIGSMLTFWDEPALA